MRHINNADKRLKKYIALLCIDHSGRKNWIAQIKHYYVSNGNAQPVKFITV